MYKSCITLNESSVDTYQKKYFHIPVILSLIIEQDHIKKDEVKCPSYKYQASNWTEFKEYINEELINSKQNLNLNDLNKFRSELMKIVKRSADKAIPVFKKISRVVNFPLEIMELIRLKNRCRKMVQQTKSDNFADNFKKTFSDEKNPSFNCALYNSINQFLEKPLEKIFNDKTFLSLA